MDFGVSAFAWTGKFGGAHLRLLPLVKEYGFSAFEIPMFLPEELPATAIRKAFEENHLQCSVCSILPEGINPISPEAVTRKRSSAHLVACIETAAEMGAHLLCGPILAPIGYLPGHRPTQDEWDWAIEILQSAGEHLDKNDLILAIEPVNRSETFFIRTACDAKSLCEAVAHPRIGVTIDTFHANVEEKSIPEAIECLGSHLKHLHISENDRGLLGAGHVDFTGCLNVLKRTGYDGTLMIEGFGYKAGEASAPGTLWADLDVSPEELASKGLAYLKSLL